MLTIFCIEIPFRKIDNLKQMNEIRFTTFV